jgi:fido (protein-threonine AMPylation protein)
MVKQPPPWQAHNISDFDMVMSERCSELLVQVRADAKVRNWILSDPRGLHKNLFFRFAPPTCTEYAGTYRGTPGTTLKSRRMSAKSELQPGGEFEFVNPAEVPARMQDLLAETSSLLEDSSADDTGKLIALSYTFCWFGKVHPFLDGNGHIQRAIFAAMAIEFGFLISKRFAIHPRPYDRLLATALEIFTRSPAGDENGELALVAEYLGFFLDGSFDAPRKNLLAASPYR